MEPPDGDWEIERQIGGEIDIATFQIHDPANTITLNGGHQVIIESFSDSSVRYFGGNLTEVVQMSMGLGKVYQCKALGWVFDLSRTVVNQIFTGKSDQFIITDTSTGIFLGTSAQTVLKDLSAYTVTTANVLEAVANTQLRVYNGETIRDIMDDLAAESGWVWGVEPDQTVFYRPFDVLRNSQSLSDAPDGSSSFGYYNFRYMRNFQEIVNAVYVYGGWFANTGETRNYKADGTETDFKVPHHWRAADPGVLDVVVVEENTGTDGTPIWTSRTVGRVQDPEAASFEVLWDELQTNFFWATAPSAGALAWRVSGTIYEPAMGSDKNNDSITANGQFELVIKDDSIRDDDRANARATAELDKRGSEGERITCVIHTDGFEVGKACTVVNAQHGLNGDYMIHKMVMHGLGGSVTEYELTLNKIPVAA